MLQTNQTIDEQMYIQVIDAIQNAAGYTASLTGGTQGCIIPTVTAPNMNEIKIHGGQLTVPNWPWEELLVNNPVPLSWTGTSLSTPVSLWRVNATDMQLTLAIDIPGVRLVDLSVTVDQNVMKVNGKRFDNQNAVFQTYVVPVTFDAKSASATLEAGILTIQFSRAKDQVLHKVTVKGVK